MRENFRIKQASLAPLTKLLPSRREYSLGYCDNDLYRLPKDRTILFRALSYLEGEERRN